MLNPGLMKEYIIFQKSEIVIDEIGNHKSTWKNFYKCHAYINGENGIERSSAGMIISDYDIAFTVRCCNKLREINSKDFRIVFNHEIYNITFVDHMGYKKDYLKFKCKRELR